MATLEKSSFPTPLVDPFEPTADRAEGRYRFNLEKRTLLITLGITAFFLVVTFVLAFADPEQFFFSYLIGWFFCLTLTLGALFFVMVHHITRARWPVVVRRIPEALLWSFPLLALLALPLLFGLHDLYHWTHEEVYTPGGEEYDEILAGKQAYLNVPFFLGRLALYFIVWSFIAYKLYSLSLRQDVDPDREIPAKQRKVSAWGIPVFAVTLAFASYDLLMSLDPHWFSTIFGVYIFAGAFSSAIALIALTAILLQRRGGVLKRTVTVEHYHDLGKWMFAFTVFWAYIAFSQYMLIWYGGLPEETVFYRHRLEHGWQWHSAALLILHFILPFFILLPRATKRTVPVLGVMAVWFLIMQWFDLYWIAMPVHLGDHAAFHALDFTCWLGLFGLFVSLFMWRLSRHSLVPERDPYLPASLRFENV